MVYPWAGGVCAGGVCGGVPAWPAITAVDHPMAKPRNTVTFKLRTISYLTVLPTQRYGNIQA